jgi:tetratricopeptide (TPR) repeat protein
MDTLKTLNNLALLYNKKCDYKRAEELYKRCLDRFQESMGKDHELTIRVRNNLAGLYAAQGENEVAKEHYDLCLQSSERNFRRIGVLDDNALSASIKNNFAVLLQRMKRLVRIYH